MAKVQIKDLENLVLEGGGAKGAAYAGAIIAIEEKLSKEYQYVTNQLPPNPKAILDYGKIDSDGFLPQIHRFAGASAGAITCFALALGLDSSLVKACTEFEFKKFLTDTDCGKYRMLDWSGNAKIGEDKKTALGMGNGTTDYVYSLTERQEIKASLVKAKLRNYLVGLITKAIISGSFDVIDDTAKTLNSWYQGIKSKGQTFLDALPINLDGLVVYGVKAFANFLQGQSGNTNNPSPQVFQSGTPVPKPSFMQYNMIAKTVWKFVGGRLLKRSLAKMSREQGMNLGVDAISNAIWDRGMFSGFMVREFFFDMMILASVNDTHFQRSMWTKQSDRDQLLALKDKMNMKSGRLAVDFSALPKKLRDDLADLPKLTFKKFHEKTRISLTLCVSNFTTDEPSYFSEYWSPDFPVMEAVGASMSIPPAIKPVFNEGNAIEQDIRIESRFHLDKSKIGKKAGKDKDYFDMELYQMKLAALKTLLSKNLKHPIPRNNPLSVSGHLTVLRMLIYENELTKSFNQSVEVNGETIELDYDDLLYLYNCAFKGLLMDGGYKCNIPYNVFRTATIQDGIETIVDPLLAKTLAIKLDNTFPEEWIHEIYQQLAEPYARLGSPKQLRNEHRKLLGKILHANFRSMFVNTYTRSKALFVNADEADMLDDNCFENIAEFVVDLYNEMSTKYRKPWNKDKSIVATAGEGYSYGAEAGQIRFLSDHEHILPLYSFGLSCYDFDLGKYRGLADLSQKRAYEETKRYFYSRA